MKSFGGRVVDLALSLLLAALLIRIAWSIIRPLVPMLAIVALGGVALRYLIQRRGAL